MSHTVEMNLSHLTELLRMSKSLVFVPDRATAKLVRKACHELGLPCYLVEPTNTHYLLNFEQDKENFATVVVPESMDNPWQSLAEQVIWVGPVPEVGHAEVMRAYESTYSRAANSRATHTLANWGRT